MGSHRQTNNQIVNINLMPFHGSKLYIGIDSEGKEDGVLCTTDEEESNWLSRGYRFVPVRMLSDYDRTTANWERERSALPVFYNSVENSKSSISIDRMINTESSSSSDRMISITDSNTINVNISTSELPLPLIFKGADPLTAESVILIYEKGTASYSPAYTWTSQQRRSTWVDNAVRKNNNNAYCNLCRDYIYLHSDKKVRGSQKIKTTISRTNVKGCESYALDLIFIALKI
jgi:hypothetical protein